MSSTEFDREKVIVRDKRIEKGVWRERDGASEEERGMKIEGERGME